MPEKNY